MVLFEPPPALPPSTSAELNDLIMGLLAKDPHERCASQFSYHTLLHKTGLALWVSVGYGQSF